MGITSGSSQSLERRIERRNDRGLGGPKSPTSALWASRNAPAASARDVRLIRLALRTRIEPTVTRCAVARLSLSEFASHAPARWSQAVRADAVKPRGFQTETRSGRHVGADRSPAEYGLVRGQTVAHGVEWVNPILCCDDDLLKRTQIERRENGSSP